MAKPHRCPIFNRRGAPISKTLSNSTLRGQAPSGQRRATFLPTSRLVTISRKSRPAQNDAAACPRTLPPPPSKFARRTLFDPGRRQTAELRVASDPAFCPSRRAPCRPSPNCYGAGLRAPAIPSSENTSPSGRAQMPFGRCRLSQCIGRNSGSWPSTTRRIDFRRILSRQVGLRNRAGPARRGSADLGSSTSPNTTPPKKEKTPKKKKKEPPRAPRRSDSFGL